MSNAKSFKLIIFLAFSFVFIQANSLMASDLLPAESQGFGFGQEAPSSENPVLAARFFFGK